MDKKTLNNALWEIIRAEGIEVTNQNIDWLLERAWKSAQVTDAPPAETREKQIEEMAKDICEYARGEICILDDKRCDMQCTSAGIAEKLVVKGYRKATDVAREIIKLARSGAEKYINDVTLNEGIRNMLSIMLDDFIAELKKKYTEGEG